VVIDYSLSDAHTIETIDLDADGRDEIIAGFRASRNVYICRVRGAKWNREILDEGSVSATSCAAADLNDDGKPEIACIGQATHNLVMWTSRLENRALLTSKHYKRAGVDREAVLVEKNAAGVLNFHFAVQEDESERWTH
jgi:hypothetical protein